MDRSTLLATLASACHRYGPGRLPGAERAAVGAGYAGASAALLAVLTWILGVGVLTTIGAAAGSPGVDVLPIYAIAVVVPVAFVAGTLVWRHLPDRTPHFGAVAGLLGTLGTYAGSLLVLAIAFSVQFGGLSIPGIEHGVRVAVAYGAIGFVLTCWVTLPAGVVTGVVYERVGVASP